jgi:hypothetical protein
MPRKRRSRLPRFTNSSGANGSFCSLIGVINSSSGPGVAGLEDVEDAMRSIVCISYDIVGEFRSAKVWLAF